MMTENEFTNRYREAMMMARNRSGVTMSKAALALGTSHHTIQSHDMSPSKSLLVLRRILHVRGLRLSDLFAEIESDDGDMIAAKNSQIAAHESRIKELESALDSIREMTGNL